jgi:hypothetical protein
MITDRAHCDGSGQDAKYDNMRETLYSLAVDREIPMNTNAYAACAVALSLAASSAWAAEAPVASGSRAASGGPAKASLRVNPPAHQSAQVAKPAAVASAKPREVEPKAMYSNATNMLDREDGCAIAQRHGQIYVATARDAEQGNNESFASKAQRYARSIGTTLNKWLADDDEVEVASATPQNATGQNSRGREFLIIRVE